jgi:hypothetical protein
MRNRRNKLALAHREITGKLDGSNGDFALRAAVAAPRPPVVRSKPFQTPVVELASELKSRIFGDGDLGLHTLWCIDARGTFIRNPRFASFAQSAKRSIEDWGEGLCGWLTPDTWCLLGPDSGPVKPLSSSPPTVSSWRNASSSLPTFAAVCATCRSGPIRNRGKGVCGEPLSFSRAAC